MQQFIRKFGQCLSGVLHGFDRLRFRGSLLLLCGGGGCGGMRDFLWRNNVLLKNFKSFVGGVTERVRCASERIAEGTPHGKSKYLNSTAISKEQIAREMIARYGVREGLACVLRCVEPCRAFRVRNEDETKLLRLDYGERQCLHYYFYFLHREFGLLHVRLQTWFPFSIHVWINGREWLARQLDRASIDYQRRDNCFTWIADFAAAQKLMDRQLRRSWPRLLNGLRRLVHPQHESITRNYPMDYYWSVDESEWATDLMFRSPDDLARLYPRLLRHGMLTFGSGDVMRFLGRKVPAAGVHANFRGQVVSDLVDRPQGVRIKHRVKRNSIKMYDKQKSVLRVETTLIDPKDMKVFRAKQDDPDGPKAWRTLRKGVADLHRRAQVSQSSNERYLEALAAADDERTVAELAESVCRPAFVDGRRYRALNPLAEDDARLLAAVHRGEFAVNGFRNADLRAVLFPSGDGDGDDPAQRRRQSGQITRKLALLRAHGLIKKVPKTHRYVLTAKGQTTIATLLTAREATTKQLNQAA
jgi:hypothetical protein